MVEARIGYESKKIPDFLVSFRSFEPVNGPRLNHGKLELRQSFRQPRGPEVLG